MWCWAFCCLVCPYCSWLWLPPIFIPGSRWACHRYRYHFFFLWILLYFWGAAGPWSAQSSVIWWTTLKATSRTLNLPFACRCCSWWCKRLPGGGCFRKTYGSIILRQRCNTCMSFLLRTSPTSLPVCHFWSCFIVRLKNEWLIPSPFSFIFPTRKSDLSCAC